MMKKATTTIVTAYWNLGRESWSSSFGCMKEFDRPSDFYLKHASTNILSLKNPMIIYCDQDTAQFVQKRRVELGLEKLTMILVTKFDELYYAQPKIDHQIQTIIKESQESSCHKFPERLVPKYIELIWSKLQLVWWAIDQNFFLSENFAWIDFGAHNAFPSSLRNQTFVDVSSPNNYDRLFACAFGPPVKEGDIFGTYRSIAGGCLCGSAKAFDRAKRGCHTIIEKEFLQQRKLGGDEVALHLLYFNDFDLFHLCWASSWDQVVLSVHETASHVLQNSLVLDASHTLLPHIEFYLTKPLLLDLNSLQFVQLLTEIKNENETKEKKRRIIRFQITKTQLDKSNWALLEKVKKVFGKDFVVIDQEEEAEEKEEETKEKMIVKVNEEQIKERLRASPYLSCWGEPETKYDDTFHSALSLDKHKHLIVGCLDDSFAMDRSVAAKSILRLNGKKEIVFLFMGMMAAQDQENILQCFKNCKCLFFPRVPFDTTKAKFLRTCDYGITFEPNPVSSLFCLSQVLALDKPIAFWTISEEWEIKTKDYWLDKKGSVIHAYLNTTLENLVNRFYDTFI